MSLRTRAFGQASINGVDGGCGCCLCLISLRFGCVVLFHDRCKKTSNGISLGFVFSFDVACFLTGFGLQ